MSASVIEGALYNFIVFFWGGDGGGGGLVVGGVSGGVERSCIGESGWRVVFLICVGISLVGLWACGWYCRVVRIRTCLYSYTVTHFGCAVC
ncbi:hypothetical protein BGY98DRAFT_1036937, partial [Russula aff. rugulosa BPL654]